MNLHLSTARNFFRKYAKSRQPRGLLKSKEDIEIIT